MGLDHSAGGDQGADEAGGKLTLGPMHIDRMRVLGSLLRSAVAEQRWERAMDAARALTLIHELVYPEVCVDFAVMHRFCLGCIDLPQVHRSN